MTSVAKKIFSKLGSKANSHNHHRSWAASQSSDYLKPDQKKSKPYQDITSMQELPNNEVFAAYELPNTYISEMTGSELSPPMRVSSDEMEVDIWDDNFYTASLDDWDMPPPPLLEKNLSPKPATLRLDTSFSSLTPSTFQGHIPQRTNSERWPDMPSSPCIISPLSAGPVLSAAPSMLEVSPTDSDASGNSFFTDSGYSSATTTLSTWNMSVACEQLPMYEDTRGKKRAYEDEPVNYEDWIHFDEQNMMAVAFTKDISANTNVHEDCIVPCPVHVSSEVTHSHPVKVSAEVTRLQQSDCGIGSHPRQVTMHWCDAPTLVLFFSEALDVHISHTKIALQDLAKTPITQELLAMSKISMVSIGLEVLTGILEGRKPTAIVQVFAFIHIACAFVIAAEHDEGKIVSNIWFTDMLAWVEELGPPRLRGLYGQIVKTIWKPAESTCHEQLSVPNSSFTTRHNSEDIQAENVLFMGCKNFLDILGSYCTSNGKQLTEYMTGISLIKSLLPEESFGDSGEDEDHRLPSFLEDELLFDISFDTDEFYSADDGSSLPTLNEGADQVLHQPLSRSSSSASSHVAQGQNSMSRHVSNSSSASYNSHYATPSYQNRHDLELPLQNISRFHQNLSIPTLRLTRPSPPPSMAKGFSTQGTPTSLEPKQHLRPLDHESYLQTKNHNILSVTNFYSHSAPPNLSPIIPPSSNTISHPHNLVVSTTTPNASSTPANATNSSCSLCDYKPTGEEKWKASNLRRHERTQHPKQAKMYPCRFPGCVKTFRRSDNLGNHIRDKGHSVSIGMPIEGDGKSDVGREFGLEVKGERIGEISRSGKKRRIDTCVGKEGRGG